MAGKLILCASPIGNLDDAPPRLRQALEEADVIYAEDTRRSRVLLDHLGVTGRPRSFFAGNENDRSAEVESHLGDGRTIALLTDAGTPTISDPGYSAVQAAMSAGAVVTVVAGPSAVTAALAVSGLPAERFVFEGFLPRRGADRRYRLEELASEGRTIVLFAAPPRLVSDLADLAAALGEERPVVVARELTKAFEEVWRGTMGEAVHYWKNQRPRGEVTLVVGGAALGDGFESALARLSALLDEGIELSTAVKRVAAETGVGRNRLYEAALERREA